MLELDYKRFRIYRDAGTGYRPDEGKEGCPSCHRRLSRATWDDKKDMLTCLHWDCVRYLQKIKCVKRSKL
jgi:hypothetical protein